MINDISFQVFLEVHFSHFVEYINIMRVHAYMHTHTHTSLWDGDIHECVQSHTHASFHSIRCSSILVYDGCTHSWQVIFGLVDLRTVQYVAPCSFRCDTFHLYFWMKFLEGKSAPLPTISDVSQRERKNTHFHEKDQLFLSLWGSHCEDCNYNQCTAMSAPRRWGLSLLPPLLFSFFYPPALLCFGVCWLFSVRNTSFLLSILDKEALLSLVHGFNGGISTRTMVYKPFGWQGAGRFS